MNASKKAATVSIPRGYRQEYIPCWTAESDRLYDEFCRSGDPDVADDLLHSLDNSRNEKWMKSVQEMNFTHSSRKSWSLIRRLGAATPNFKPKSNISPESIESRLVKLTKVKLDSTTEKQVKSKLRKEKKKGATVIGIFQRILHIGNNYGNRMY